MNLLRRNRRLRVNDTIRALVRETTVTPNDFIVPLFVVEGKGVKEEIPSMPDYYRYIGQGGKGIVELRHQICIAICKSA